MTHKFTLSESPNEGAFLHPSNVTDPELLKLISAGLPGYTEYNAMNDK